MVTIISARELFDQGCAERFQVQLESNATQKRVEEILNKAGVVAVCHANGRPNNSRPSTIKGTSSAAKCLLKNTLEFDRDDDKLYGQNIKEAIFTLKKFFK